MKGEEAGQLAPATFGAGVNPPSCGSHVARSQDRMASHDDPPAHQMLRAGWIVQKLLPTLGKDPGEVVLVIGSDGRSRDLRKAA